MARRKDGVDEQYRDRYRKWAGRTYKGKHPSHLVEGGSCENNSPGLQMFASEEPGDRLQL